VHNSINVDEFRNDLADAANRAARIRERFGIDEDSLVFLNVGRYVPQKNQAKLVKAMKQVVRDRPEAQLFVIGWGELTDDLQATVIEHGLESNVHITGRVDTVEEYYHLANVFVLSSHWEGLSIASIEALAAGLPIVGTDVPGVREVVEHEENGYLVAPDSASALAEAMTALYSESRRARFGDVSGRLVRDRYSIEAMISSYLSLYNKYQ
jgi:glycosyltransferase involved in cell wall biosynthesis